MKRAMLGALAVLAGLILGYIVGAMVGFFVPSLLGASMNEAAEAEAVLGPVGAIAGVYWMVRRMRRTEPEDVA